MSIDFTDLFAPTPYPVNPLAQILTAVYRTQQVQKARREDTAQRQRAQDLQDYSLLTDLAQRHQNAGQEIPQPILARLNSVQQRLMGAGLGTANIFIPGEVTQPKMTIPGGIARAEGMRTVIPEQRAPGRTEQRFVYPGPKPPEFQTVGEMAAKFGYKLRPNVDPMLRLDSLPRNVNPFTLFVDPQEERQQAKDRIEQLVKTYGEKQVLATPELRDAVMKDWETATGRPFPTRLIPETEAVPRRRPGEGSLGQFLTPQGTQQIPTGGTVREPILPEAQVSRQAAIFQDAMRQAGGDYNKAYRIASTVAPDIFPPKMEPEMHPLVAANIISQMEERSARVRQLLAGGAGGLTAADQRLLTNYNRLTDQRLEILKTLGAGTADAATKQQLQQELDRLNRQTSQLEPRVNVLLYGSRGGPAPGAGVLTQDVIADIQAGAQRGIPWAQIEQALRADGVTDPKVLQQARRAYDSAAAAPSGGQGPLRVSSEVENLIRSMVTALQRQRVDLRTARVRVFDELRKRGMNIGDQNLANAVNAILSQVYGGPPTVNP